MIRIIWIYNVPVPARAAFEAQYTEEYSALDRACERLTAAERLVGVFEPRAHPPR